MKRQLYFLITFFLFGFISKGQTTFQKTFSGPNMDMGKDVFQTNDGGYLISEELLDNTVGYFIGLIKTNFYGDTTWTKKYGLVTPLSQHVIEIPNVGYAITYISANSSLILVRTDINGDTLWSREYAGKYLENSIPIKLTSDSAFIMACTYWDSISTKTNIALLKTDLNGIIQWSKSYGLNPDDRAYSLIQTADSGFAILGSADLGVMNNYDVLLIKTDSTGNLLWSKTYGSWYYEYGRSIVQTTDGGYFISSSPGSGFAGLQSLIRTDMNGDTLWVKGYYSNSGENESSVVQTPDGGFALINTIKDSTFLDKACLVKTNGNGDTLWTQVYGNDMRNNFSFQGTQTADGGFVFTGTSVGMPPDSEVVCIIKTDSSGWSGCNQKWFPSILASPLPDVSTYSPMVTSINLTTAAGGLQICEAYHQELQTICLNVGIEESFFKKSLFKIYPNPTSDKFSISENYFGELEIYDLVGKRVKESQLVVSDHQTFSSPQQPGVYFVSLQTATECLVSKLIVR